MRKISVAIITVAMLVISCVHAFAVVSPEVDIEKGTCTNNPCPNGGNVGGGSVGGGSPALSTTSAKTGVSVNPAIFATLGVVACGGVAVIAKKKIKA